MWRIRSTSSCCLPMIPSRCPERIVRQANKVGLFNALSFGDIMLRGQLKEAKK